MNKQQQQIHRETEIQAHWERQRERQIQAQWERERETEIQAQWQRDRERQRHKHSGETGRVTSTSKQNDRRWCIAVPCDESVYKFQQIFNSWLQMFGLWSEIAVWQDLTHTHTHASTNLHTVGVKHFQNSIIYLCSTSPCNVSLTSPLCCCLM